MSKIEEIKQRLNATTKGKWLTENIPYDGIEDPVIITEDGEYIAQTAYDMQGASTNHNVDEDTIFIAHAKEDIQYLLDFIENIKNNS